MSVVGSDLDDAVKAGAPADGVAAADMLWGPFCADAILIPAL